MAQLKLERILLAAAIALLPMSYYTKTILGLREMTWVDPTLVLAAALVVLRPSVVRFDALTAFALLAIPGAIIGYACLPNSSPLAILREPLRLALNVGWYFLCLRLWSIDRAFACRWLSVSVIAELLLAAWRWLDWAGLVPAPWISAAVRSANADKQLLWFGDVIIQRFMGTFEEGPPFGLFMLSALCVLLLAWWKLGERSRLVTTGVIAALAGTVCSLSDQIFLGLATLVLFAGAGVCSRPRYRWVGVAALVAAMAFSPYAVERLATKADEITANPRAASVSGQSGGERAFHVRFGLRLLDDSPGFAVLGIGPGRYGEYAARAWGFPDSTVMQVAPAEWLVEHGIVGVTLMLAWLLGIAVAAGRGFGLTGLGAFLALVLGVAFEANWKWEFWFLALAFLGAAHPTLRESARFDPPDDSSATER